MDLFLSVLSMLMLWLMGNKSHLGPIVGVINQFFWLYYTLSTKQYGLLPGVVGFGIIHVRNVIKWRRS